ncbi:MAG TPA: prepilin-type N-terminal cleavage/methylation domain-containing protein [Syntrophales bacterium]|jgi:Tfp pilus assembly protein PilV|nr:prepilin-type N-terminal cleavage/methylation domain-containing protein [Syntrophales bacterium]HPX56388.1 prepilin-type N-terminal cleavage/methylation domain-containing protein [Syntrophales bacterium]HQA83238.1 prepilin-type N-terminal cleavage/methylation domain-containing protein [Syntrophales bacterium]
MFHSKCNNRGFTLVEVVIALFITTVAVLSIFALMSPAWQTTSRSDLMGRAANILYDRLQQEEARIMNPCNKVVASTTGPVSIYASGGTAAQASGDVAFNVTTTVATEAADVWRVTVRVAWPGHDGISESLIVTRQDAYRFPEGCSIL